MDDVNPDIARHLREWDYDPDSNVRKIVGEDGVHKLQVRIDQGAFQGILQLNLDGRPDGKRPHDSEFVLDYYCASLAEHRAGHSGDSEGFELDRDSCRELFDESARVYGRYVFLLQLKEYDRVIRDTERNMRLFEFVHTYASHEDDRQNLQKWWSYIRRINATARATLAFQEEKFDEALAIVEQAREKIAGPPEVDAEESFIERERSLEALDELAAEFNRNRPMDHKEQLEKQLQAAIEREDFETAVTLRDQLKDLAALDGGC